MHSFTKILSTLNVATMFVISFVLNHRNLNLCWIRSMFQFSLKQSLNAILITWISFLPQHYSSSSTYHFDLDFFFNFNSSRVMNLIVYLHFCTIILHNAQEFCTQQLKFVWTFAQIFLSFLSSKERLEILPFVNRLILI